jgi:hypothetical protein
MLPSTPVPTTMSGMTPRATLAEVDTVELTRFPKLSITLTPYPPPGRPEKRTYLGSAVEMIKSSKTAVGLSTSSPM